jgi:glycosyltransferase involved in cell wall biosynthesis
MRIAIDGRLALKRPTGIGRVALNLARNLSLLDAANEYIWMSPLESTPDLRGIANVREVRVPGHLAIRGQFKLPRLLKACGVDLVDWHCLVTPLFSTTPAVVTMYDANYSRFPSLLPLQHRVQYRFWMGHRLRLARRIICISNSTLEDMHRFFPRSRKTPASVVYLGVDERFRPPQKSDPAAAKSSLGLPDSYILYVGNLLAHKNVPRLVEAFSRAARYIPHCLVLPEARGRDAELTLRAVARHGPADRIIFHPIPDDALPLIYGLADAFVFPSLAEGFGLPPVEAMACGTPVITSNVSSLPEVVGDAGIQVDPLDVQALADAVVRLLTDRELHAEMRQRGIERAAGFTWDRTAREYFRVYLEAYAG